MIPREQIRNILALRQRKIIKDKTRIPSAVLLLLFEKNGEIYLLFTKRTEQVATHKGQISFPGGVCDPEDPSCEITALREAFEEVGIEPGEVDILGVLDDCRTLSTHFVITPVVGVLSSPLTTHFHINPGEVAKIIEIPLAFFQDAFKQKAQSRLSAEDILNGEPVFRYGENLIWGATARIMVQFLSLLNLNNNVK